MEEYKRSFRLKAIRKARKSDQKPTLPFSPYRDPPIMYVEQQLSHEDSIKAKTFKNMWIEGEGCWTESVIPGLLQYYNFNTDVL